MTNLLFNYSKLHMESYIHQIKLLGPVYDQRVCRVSTIHGFIGSFVSMLVAMEVTRLTD